MFYALVQLYYISQKFLFKLPENQTKRKALSIKLRFDPQGNLAGKMYDLL